MPPSVPATDPIVCIVDDDAALRRSLLYLGDSVGWAMQAYACAEDFLREGLPLRPDCLVVDVRMPGMSGLELQRELQLRRVELPLIFISGHGDIAMAVDAMKHGAVDFLEKPFRDQALLDAVERALRARRQAAVAAAQQRACAERLDALTPREREVAEYVACGLANKRIARLLEISEKTVHVHRQHVFEKTGCGSAAELARLFAQADPEFLARAQALAPGED
ncbi:response regulator transcription factor [Plasticicumulans acidivorans]|uniref:LuxR family two component transcriptional regulator n=1 Tax=Plasticicumulans acidivorans TaxID=886464 RepID=A0A317MXI8_9GAMM|nr:response regulator [Plasticicumulans acidivorans]PWV63234.1 LuxR family two component transcriptional regulator [Plasticicumulans acidivorans]